MDQKQNRDAEIAREPAWFVLRDLKRHNAKLPAYKFLPTQGIEVFTPMRWQLVVRQGRRVRVEVPFLRDLLFAYTTRGRLDPIIERQPSLQYRFVKGAFHRPMEVDRDEMERFIRAIRATEAPLYYRPEEVTPEMYGRRIRIEGGLLDGYEGRLLSRRGARVKRLLVEIPDWVVTAVEVNPEYIRFL